jgi:acyl-CoA oxidase
MTFAPDPADPDRPIASCRNFRRSATSALATAYAMTFLVHHAKRAFLAAPESPQVHQLLGITKVLCSGWAENLLTELRERCGAQGMFSMNRVIDYLGFAHGAVTAEGDNQVMLLKTAGDLLSGVVHDPLIPSKLFGSSLLDEDFWLHVLRCQEQSRLEQVRRKLAASKGTFSQVWDAAANDAIALGRAHGGRIALEQFLAAVRAAPDPQAARLLRRLAGLFALTEIKRESGWLLASGILSGEDVLTLDDTLDQVCDSVDAVAETLIEAFGIPAQLLSSPIADEDFTEGFASRMPRSAFSKS